MANNARKAPKRNPPPGFGSIRAYAAHRKQLKLPGGTHAAVRKAIDEGRISGPDPNTLWIDFAKADREWANNTTIQPIQGFELDPFREIPIDPLTQEPDWNCYPALQRGPQRLIWLKQRDYEQRLEQRAGILVHRAKVRRTLHDHGRQRRADVVNSIPRMSQQIARGIRLIVPRLSPSDEAKILHAIEVTLNGELVATFSQPIIDIAVDPDDVA